MKKMMKLFAAAFVAIVAVSCLKENIENGGQNADVKMVEVTFGADFNAEDPDDTKTHLGYDNAGAPVINWTRGDKVAVIDPATKAVYPFTLCGGEGTPSGMFKGELPENLLTTETQPWCLVYPYESVVAYDKLNGTKHVIQTNLLVQQQAVKDGFPEGACISAAYVTSLEGAVKFVPVINYFKVTIVGEGITSMSVFSNNNVAVAGSTSLQLDNTNYVKSSWLNGRGSAGFSNYVSLVPAEGQETIAPGTYYFTCRSDFDNGDTKGCGMTLKFNNNKGEVAYYSSEEGFATPARNTTKDLKTWDASSINWKKEDVITIDFSTNPFEEELTTAKGTAIEGTYTLSSNGRQVYISTAALENVSAYETGTTRGLLFGSAVGNYIEFPAIPGKKLKEVQVTTAYKSTLHAGMTDAEGTDMEIGPNSPSLYANSPYSYIMPRAEINKKYRYVVNNYKASQSQVRLQKIILFYSGDDVAEIKGVNASAVNAFDGFTVTGSLLGGGLDAATWGIEYGTSEDNMSEAATGNGGTINQFVEAAAGTYYVKVWASADGGENKTYSDVMNVQVKPFSGTITFDFSSETVVRQNLTYVGTTDTKTPVTATNIIANRQFAHEETGISDYFTYTTADGVFPFTMLSYIDPTGVDSSNKPVTTGYEFCNASYSAFRVHGCGYKNSVFMSIPKVDGYRLSKTTFYSITNDARGHVCTSAIVYDKDQIGTASDSEVKDENEYYVYTMDFTGKKNTADDQCWLIYSKNRWNKKIVFEYEKVVE